MARAAVEQGDPQPFLQLLDLHGKCRWRQVQLGRGLAEVAAAGHGEEGLDVLDRVLHFVFRIQGAEYSNLQRLARFQYSRKTITVRLPALA